MQGRTMRLEFRSLTTEAKSVCSTTLSRLRSGDWAITTCFATVRVRIVKRNSLRPVTGFALIWKGMLLDVGYGITISIGNIARCCMLRGIRDWRRDRGSHYCCVLIERRGQLRISTQLRRRLAAFSSPRATVESRLQTHGVTPGSKNILFRRRLRSE